MLSRNVGKNSFAFLLETGGLVLTEQNGQFVLVNPETEQQVGRLGEIIVFDSAGQIVRGNMTAQTILAGQKYGITISIDQEFLASATYPVAIDPTVRLDPVHEDAEYGETVMIEDVSIYNNINVQGYTFIEWHQIGEVFDTGYQGQAAFRFPILYTPSELYGYSSLTADQIFSFTLHLKSTTNTTETNTLRVCQYVPPWPNTFKIFDTDYFGYFNFTDNDISVIDVPQDSSFCIDLTGFVKQWKDLQHGLINDYYLGSAETGVLLWNDDDSGKIWLESVEYSTSIYATMDYVDSYSTSDVYFNNRFSSTFLAADVPNDDVEMLSGLVSDIGPLITWTPVYRGNDGYTLHPNGQTNLYLNIFGGYDTTMSCENIWYQSIAQGGGVTWTAREEFEDGDVYEYVLGVNDFGDVCIDDPSEFTNSQKAWRIVHTTSYEEFSTSERERLSVEVGQGISLPFAAMVGNATFAQKEDFTYETTDYATIDRGTTQIYGIAEGIELIVITHIPTNQKLYQLVDVIAPVIIVPCILNRTVDLSLYLSSYQEILLDTVWYNESPEIITVSSCIVTGSAQGIGAYVAVNSDHNPMLKCIVYVVDILSHFSQKEAEYLALDGTFLGDISRMHATANNMQIDPLLLRVEWYIYIVNALTNGKEADEICEGLYEKYELLIGSDFQTKFIAEVDLGHRGLYSRENLIVSWDGAKFLLNTMWFNFAAYSLATLDLANQYTSGEVSGEITREVVKSHISDTKQNALINYYPPNDGFNGDPTLTTLQPGTIIQRTGGYGGQYAAPMGTLLWQLSLPPYLDGAPTTYLIVVEPILVRSGVVAPWFGSPGGGTQYYFYNTIEELIKWGYLVVYGGG